MALDPKPSSSASSKRAVSQKTILHSLLALGGLVAMFTLLIEQTALGPMLVAVVGAVLVWPLRSVPAARPIVLALGIVIGAFLLSRLGGVLAPFIGVFVLAYLLDPVVTWAHATWKMPRWASTAVLTLAAIGAIAAAGIFLVPSLLGQIETFASDAVELALHIPDWVERSTVLDSIEDAGLIDRNALVSELATFLPSQIQSAAGQIPALVTGLARQVGTVLGLITTLALLPVLLFYTLKDFPKLRDGVVSLLPRYQGRREYLDRAGSVFGSYIRGQITISAVSAVLVAVPLALFGAPFSLLLGLLAGILNLIPSLGAILTYIIGVLVMMIFGTWTDVLIVLGVLAAQAVIEQAFLTPNIMGQQVGLHPVVILIALFSCGALFGFLGLILAVPAAALLAGAIRAYKEAFVLDLDAPTDGEVLVA
ncbi:MAG: AI-2E family transporter [Rubricoccaceae bacterium]